MGNPAVLISNGPSTSRFSNELRAYALSLFARCYSARRAQREIQEKFGTSISHDTLNDWRNQENTQAILRDQAEEVGHRATEILWDALSDIAVKPDKAKYVIPLNAVAGTMRDKLRDSPSVTVIGDIHLVQQIVAMNPEQLADLAQRGRLSAQGD